VGRGQLRSLRAARVVPSLFVMVLLELFMLPDELLGLLTLLPWPVVDEPWPVVDDDPVFSAPLCDPVVPGVRAAPLPAGPDVPVPLVEPGVTVVPVVPVVPGVEGWVVVLPGPEEPAEPPLLCAWT
jgi:hypothetical protein